jgi:hypothetical protein
MNDFIEDVTERVETLIKKAKDSAEGEPENVNKGL